MEPTQPSSRRLALHAQALRPHAAATAAAPSSAPAPQFFASHDGEQIAFRTLGSPDDCAVMLLHGYGGNGASWFDMGHPQRLVTLGFFVVVLDLRGHGASAKPV